MIHENYLSLLFVFVIAFLMTFSATPVVSMLARKVGAVDIPKDGRRMHSKPIPRLGGLAIFYGFIIAILCIVNIDAKLRGVLIGAVIVVTIGVLDDIFDLHALTKLVIQIFAASIVVLHGVQFSFFVNPLSSQYVILEGLSIPLVTILWIVMVTNAVNLIDGLDGLAVGVSTITAISLFLISIIMQEFTIALLTAAIAGSGLGFLPFNFYPAKIFMGDTGSTFLGFMLACISIMGLFKTAAILSFAVPFLVLGLPIFDTAFAIIRRLLKGQSPMKADRGHLHHKLIDMGFSQKQAVAILYTTSGLLSLSAAVLMFTNDWKKAILLIVSVIVILILGSNFYMEARHIAKGDDE